MKNKMFFKSVTAVIISAGLFVQSAFPVFAAEEVKRNDTFTTLAQMADYTGDRNPDAWTINYLTEVEQYYWNFCTPGKQDDHRLTLNLISNAYRNLEMFLDNGYTVDYNELKAYAEDYKVRRGYADAYYTILTECLKNPYVLNKPAAVVTDYTYNGRDYSKVFDPDYYYDNNPDLQASIGFNPPELLRHFVEIGICQGRIGKEGFSIEQYAAGVDAQIAAKNPALAPAGRAPYVRKYSFSPACYYGRFLNHYDYSYLESDPNEMM
ncbi:MAG: hypothetical protein E7300_06370 [Lachnospiraceae bacterium]|nr:hypothetical protein [Lachnospiraceae bacterium]